MKFSDVSLLAYTGMYILLSLLLAAVLFRVLFVLIVTLCEVVGREADNRVLKPVTEVVTKMSIIILTGWHKLVYEAADNNVKHLLTAYADCRPSKKPRCRRELVEALKVRQRAYTRLCEVTNDVQP